MYFRDHPPPHLHVVTSSREEAQIDLRDFAVIHGHAPPQVLAAARIWATDNAKFLRDKWDELHPA